jgi:hypothetical protein
VSTLIIGRDEEMLAWASAKLPGGGNIRLPAVTIGVAHGADILAVAVFNNFCHYGCEVSFVASTPLWATKGSIRAILNYPFRQMGYKRMTAITAKKNKRSRKLLEGLGFVQEGVHPFGIDGVQTGISYGLYRDTAEAKWLKDVPR